MRLKRVAIENTLGEHIGSLMGTCREQRKNEKKSRHFECMLRLPIGCMKFSISKTVGHHFRPELIALLQTEGTYSFRVGIFHFKEGFFKFVSLGLFTKWVQRIIDLSQRLILHPAFFDVVRFAYFFRTS
jgi:hypothetical protein